MKKNPFFSFDVTKPFGFDLAPAITNNICWDTLLAAGTVYSSDVTPTHTSDGTLIYNIQFDTSTGLFIAQFGVLGDEIIKGSKDITLTFGDDSIVLYFDLVERDYRYVNQVLADSIALEVGSKVCFGFVVGTDSRNILTDVNGNPLVDENGFYLYTDAYPSNTSYPSVVAYPTEGI